MDCECTAGGSTIGVAIAWVSAEKEPQSIDRDLST